PEPGTVLNRAAAGRQRRALAGRSGRCSDGPTISQPAAREESRSKPGTVPQPWVDVPAGDGGRSTSRITPPGGPASRNPSRTADAGARVDPRVADLQGHRPGGRP